MNIAQRRLFLILFTAFFIVLLPFIVIFSLGYGIDFRSRSVQNNLTINLETYPRNATAEIAKQTFQTPAELGVESGNRVDLEISKESFVTENFRLWSEEKTNSNARISSLWLLPKEKNGSYSLKNDKIVDILDENKLLAQKTGQKGYYILNYGFAGPENNPQDIINSENYQISDSRWQKLLENTFWQREEGLVLYQKSPQNWEFIDLNRFNQKFKSIAVVNKNTLILLDNQSNLWSYEIESKSLTFIEKGFLGLAFTEAPDAIWVLGYNAIYRFERADLKITSLNFNQSIFLQNNQLKKITLGINPDNWNNFVPKNLFLGLVFKIDGYLIYIPDSNKDSWQVITSDAEHVGTFRSTVFWITSDNHLYTYNLLIKDQKFLQIPDLNPYQSQDYIVFYYPGWKRFFIYTKTQVVSIWIDTEISNKGIIRYTPISWILDSKCSGEIKNNYQYCLKNGSLDFYKNDTFPFP